MNGSCMAPLPFGPSRHFPPAAGGCFQRCFSGLKRMAMVWTLVLTGWCAGAAGPALGIGFEGMGRDVFPVFNNPRLLTAAQAEAGGVVFPRDAVIGVALGGEAKAYPISIMGFIELGNDTLAGIPIAVSW